MLVFIAKRVAYYLMCLLTLIATLMCVSIIRISVFLLESFYFIIANYSVYIIGIVSFPVVILYYCCSYLLIVFIRILPHINLKYILLIVALPTLPTFALICFGFHLLSIAINRLFAYATRYVRKQVLYGLIVFILYCVYKLNDRHNYYNYGMFYYNPASCKNYYECADLYFYREYYRRQEVLDKLYYGN